MFSSDIEVLAKQLLNPLQSLKLDAEYHENVFALAQTKLALDIVESTLLLKKYDAQQSQLEFETVHIGDIVSRVVNSLREYFNEHGVDYELEYSKSLPVIYADRQVVEHAVKMLFYGTQMCNLDGSAVRVRTYRNHHNQIKLSISAVGLRNNTIILHTNNSQNKPDLHPIDASRSLFSLIGGVMHKTHTASQKGFLVTLPSLEQLTIV